MTYKDFLINENRNFYSRGNTDWFIYQHALIPISHINADLSIKACEAKELLNISGAYLIRWNSNPCETETAWWLIDCTKYERLSLAKNARYGVKRGNSNCDVEIVDSRYIAENGYPCYLSSFVRYKGAKPTGKEQFQRYYRTALEKYGFEYWGIFSRQKELIGYAQCINEDEGIYTNIIKIGTNGLSNYASYALFDKLLNYYVNEKGIKVSNGSRSIYHDTNIQDFLLKFGFEKKYCQLNVMYSPPITLIIKTFYPFMKFFQNTHKGSFLDRFYSLLLQEQYRKESVVPTI